VGEKTVNDLTGEEAVCTGTVVTTTTRVPKRSRDVELWAEGLQMKPY